MADTVKKKVIDIETGSAVKNVNELTSSFTPLSKQIKDLKNQLAQLEQGTAEYNRVAKQLADTQQKQIEITEAAKYSNKDFGQTLSNVAAVSAGVVGGINAISSVMTMLGADSEKAQEAMKNIQLTMAVVQGLGAMDTAVKAIRGLNLAFASNTVATNENTTAKAANAAATGTMNTANQKGIGILGKLAAAFKTTKAAMGIWIVVITAAITAITMLVKKHKEEQEALRETKAQVDSFADGASYAAIEVTGKYNLLQKSFVEAKNKGENLTKWVKLHKAALKDLNMQNMTLDQLNKAFITDSDAYVEALKKRYTAQWKLQVIQDQVIQAMKAEQDLQNAMAKSETGTGVPNDPKEKLTILKDGEYVTKKYEEWLQIRNDANFLMQQSSAQYDKAVQDLFNADNVLASFGVKLTETTTSTKKSVKELREEFLNLWKTVVGLKFDNSSMQNTFSAYYDEVKDKMLKLRKLLKLSGVGKDLNTEFRNLLKGWKNEVENIEPWQVTLDFVFDQKKVSELYSKIEKEEQYLYDAKEGKISLSEEELEKHKKYLQSLQEEQKGMQDILAVVHQIAQENDERRQKFIDKENLKKDLQEAEEAYREYANDIRTNNPFADVNKALRETQYNIDRDNERLQILQQRLNAINETYANTNQQVEEYKRELESLKQVEQTEEVVQRIEELNGLIRTAQFNYVNAVSDVETQILEVQQDIMQQQQSQEDAMYQERLINLDAYYKQEQQAAVQQMTELEIIRTQKGGGVVDYNTSLDLLRIQMQAFENQKRNIQDYYDSLIEMQEEGSDRAIELEMEKQAALEQIDKESAQTRLDIMKEESNRKLNIAKAYYNAYQNLSSCIGNILQAEMEKYDENSEKYKELQVANAWINTLSGTLGAFMSGINSGIPAPYNLILAAAMAATTFTAGALQIANIENDSRANSMTSSASNVGSEYETTAYATQAEVVSSVGDQRVVVVENDITTTQNRVAVRESNATF